MTDAEKLARFVGEEAPLFCDHCGSRDHDWGAEECQRCGKGLTRLATLESLIAACEDRGWLYILQSKEDGTHHAWLTGQHHGSGLSARAALEAAIRKALEATE